jgi:hypothetical protein
MRRITITLLATIVALSGCDAAPDREVLKAKQVARKERAEISLSKVPETRTLSFPAGQLLVMDVPVSDVPGFAYTHRCFLWRDQEFKTASIQCPPEISSSLAGSDH